MGESMYGVPLFDVKYFIMDGLPASILQQSATLAVELTEAFMHNEIPARKPTSRGAPNTRHTQTIGQVGFVRNTLPAATAPQSHVHTFMPRRLWLCNTQTRR